jgi:predicted transcriptional regulator of viral defense system
VSLAAQWAQLRALGVPALTTADAAAVLGASVPAASHALRRLAAAGLVHAVRKGTWSLQERPDPQVLLEYVSAPHPAYVSLQSALYAHGMVEQVPSVLYAVTPGRTARVRTRVGTYSLHHVAPEFFDGYVQLPSGAKLATPEKALVDVFYLSSTRVRLFAALPELTLPRAFRVRTARTWVARIPSARLRAVASARLDEALETARRE